MQRRVIAATLFLAAILVVSCSASTQAEAQRTAPVEVGQAYKVLVSTAMLRFKVLEIGKGGLVKVQAVGDEGGTEIKKGSTWWLNLNQALLVEAIK